MSDISLFVYDSIRYWLDQVSTRKEKKEDNRLVWPSAINGCHKADALRRAKSMDIPFSFDTRLKMLIGSLVGEFVAQALVEGGHEVGLEVNPEEPFKTDLLSGKIDIPLRGPGVNSVVEVKYATYFPPGFALRNLYQIAAYMQSLKMEHGILCIIYNTKGLSLFDVYHRAGAYWVSKSIIHQDQDGATSCTDEALTMRDQYSEFPTDQYGYVRLTDEDLNAQIQDAKFWIDNAVENYDHAYHTDGPIMNADRMPFYCANAKLPEPYKTKRPGGAQIGDTKPGTGQLTCNCPFFHSCYGGIIEGSERVVEGRTYEYSAGRIGSEIAL